MGLLSKQLQNGSFPNKISQQTRACFFRSQINDFWFKVHSSIEYYQFVLINESRMIDLL